ncbi:MAG: 30S ribosomal protein S27ae [Thermoplasmata archaeon]|nr:30S ribosomal protein S27ae [Thermoplasmata archaeon]
MNKREIFKVEGDKIVRLRKTCPKCGPGVFLAEHRDRFSCGKCGYTEFKSTSNKNKLKEEVSGEVKEKAKETS